jgi:peptide/nickel transport system permease protein
MAIFADFVSPVNPKRGPSFAPARPASWTCPGRPTAGGGSSVVFPSSRRTSSHPSPSNPIGARTTRTRGRSVFSPRLGVPFPGHPHEPPPHRHGRRLAHSHPLAPTRWDGTLLSRRDHGSQSRSRSAVSIALITVIGTLLGITSGYIGGPSTLGFQRFVESHPSPSPQLPLYSRVATLIPVTAAIRACS